MHRSSRQRLPKGTLRQLGCFGNPTLPGCQTRLANIGTSSADIAKPVSHGVIRGEPPTKADRSRPESDGSDVIGGFATWTGFEQLWATFDKNPDSGQGRGRPTWSEVDQRRTDFGHVWRRPNWSDVPQCRADFGRVWPALGQACRKSTEFSPARTRSGGRPNLARLQATLFAFDR